MYMCVCIYIENQDIYVRKTVVVMDNASDINGANIIYNH